MKVVYNRFTGICKFQNIYPQHKTQRLTNYKLKMGRVSIEQRVSNN